MGVNEPEAVHEDVEASPEVVLQLLVQGLRRAGALSPAGHKVAQDSLHEGLDLGLESGEEKEKEESSIINNVIKTASIFCCRI